MQQSQQESQRRFYGSTVRAPPPPYGHPAPPQEAAPQPPGAAPPAGVEATPGGEAAGVQRCQLAVPRVPRPREEGGEPRHAALHRTRPAPAPAAGQPGAPPPAHQPPPPRFPEELGVGLHALDPRQRRRYPRWHIPVMGDPPPPQHTSGPYHQLEHMEPFGSAAWHHGAHPMQHLHRPHPAGPPLPGDPLLGDPLIDPAGAPLPGRLGMKKCQFTHICL